MWSDHARENRVGWPPPLKAALAGLAALCTAALAAAGVTDGVPPGSTAGRAAPGPPAGPAVAGGGRSLVSWF